LRYLRGTVPSGACLDENSIVAFFESGLTIDARARVDEHAAECESCRRILAEYGGMARTALVRTEPVSGVTEREAGRDGATDIARLLAHAQAARRIGTVLCGKWRIDGVIGMGGMAQVYAATHRNGRRVAVKMMRPELAVEPSLVERFLREGYVANKVGHAGAVAVLDDDVTEDGAPFLVMELLLGRTLRGRLEQDGPVPVAEALRLAEDTLEVLAAAHEHGIVHRDIKPDNLFETEDGKVKVLDFGIARLREQTVTPTQTQSGTTVGTIGYMPPEQARGRVSEVDARSDVWAAGATLFALLSGRPVHEADTLNEALLLAMTQPVPAVGTLLPSLSPEVSGLLDKALSFDKMARFADGREMLQAVRAARASVASTVSMPAPVPAEEGAQSRLRVGGSLALAVLAALAILVVAAFLYGWRNESHATSPPYFDPSAGPATASAPSPAPSASSRVEPAAPRTATGAASPAAPSETANHPTIDQAPRVSSTQPRPAAKTTPPPPPRASTTTAPPPEAVPSEPPATAPERDPLGPRR
jgi:serine/threonine protein kinase